MSSNDLKSETENMEKFLQKLKMDVAQSKAQRMELKVRKWRSHEKIKTQRKGKAVKSSKRTTSKPSVQKQSPIMHRFASKKVVLPEKERLEFSVVGTNDLSSPVAGLDHTGGNEKDTGWNEKGTGWNEKDTGRKKKKKSTSVSRKNSLRRTNSKKYVVQHPYKREFGRKMIPDEYEYDRYSTQMDENTNPQSFPQENSLQRSSDTIHLPEEYQSLLQQELHDKYSDDRSQNEMIQNDAAIHETVDANSQKSTKSPKIEQERKPKNEKFSLLLGDFNTKSGKCENAMYDEINPFDDTTDDSHDSIMLDGTFNEEESAASFQEALMAWRRGNSTSNDQKKDQSQTDQSIDSGKLLQGTYNEEESAASFQEALLAWRRNNSSNSKKDSDQSQTPTDSTKGKLLQGTYNEAESAASFQEALLAWRRGNQSLHSDKTQNETPSKSDRGSLMEGTYDEAKSAASFQEALNAWRNVSSNEKPEKPEKQAETLQEKVERFIVTLERAKHYTYFERLSTFGVLKR